MQPGNNNSHSESHAHRGGNSKHHDNQRNNNRHSYKPNSRTNNNHGSPQPNASLPDRYIQGQQQSYQQQQQHQYQFQNPNQNHALDSNQQLPYLNTNTISSSHSSHPSRTKNTSNGNDQTLASRNSRSHHQPYSPYQQDAPADMTVIINRIELWDIRKTGSTDEHYHNHPNTDHHPHQSFSNQSVAPYHFAPDVSCWVEQPQNNHNHDHQTVAVAKIPLPTIVHQQHHDLGHVVDNSIPNPHSQSVCHDKYWIQRRRLFSRFDGGIQLDGEGWYSVTPEVIADHVARRVGALSNSSAFRRGMPGSSLGASEGIVVLDAFGGCGGNAIAFGKLPPDLISKVIAVDVDRTKLRKAAHNASIYGIPTDKIIFVECNTLFIMEHCYKDGELCNLHGKRKPRDVRTEEYAGYQIGGLDLLPPRIDAVFMDPPWGGVDYNTLGKDGYRLEKNMKIQVTPDSELFPSIEEVYAQNDAAPGAEVEVEGDNGFCDDFFDTFSSGATTLNPKAKSNNPSFNQCGGGEECVNGSELLKMAAAASRSRLVIYDLPRNTNKISLGKCALAAGYRGNLKLENHYLNGRLKTITAYMGADYGGLLDHNPS